MKKLLLAAFLLTAGTLTSEKVNAQKESKVSHAPRKVLDEFQLIKANDEAMGFTYTSIIWSQVKNVFVVTITVTHPDYGTLAASAKWNAKGERIE